MLELQAFRDLGLNEISIDALQKKGFEEPTPIQKMTIPAMLGDTLNIIGQAQTGTGKTAAFGLPILELINSDVKGIKALIVTPTRELAMQVSEELFSLRGKRRVKVLPVYGGTSIDRQVRMLKEGVDVVVGTPGRLIDLFDRRVLHLDQLQVLVLDEADEMLNMGFIEDIEKIIQVSRPEKRMLLFSATMPRPILEIAKKYMKQHVILKVEKEQLTTSLTDQIYFEVNEADKLEALTRIIDIEPDFFGLVFCRTKNSVDEVTNKLTERGYDTEGLHGDMTQYHRERIFNRFREKRVNILIATDVAARGLDINNLTHVINYSLPQDPESYIHRIGRTGRAGKQGTAITFVTSEEYRKLIHIKKITNTDIRKEKLPKIKEVVSAKRNRIMDDIRGVLAADDAMAYDGMATSLLEEVDPKEMLKAVLKHFLKDELVKESYSELSTVSVDRKGKTRLFVALGKKDQTTPKKLIDLIKKEVKINDQDIRDIKIFENFSFVSMPFEEAEMLIVSLNKNKKGRKPLVERAKEKQN